MAKEETREELQAKQKQLREEVEKLEVLITSSDTSTFEIIIENIKEEMYKNIAEEDWKGLKNNKAKVEKFREVVKIVQNQQELLNEKKEELEDIEWKLNHVQGNLFENQLEGTGKTHYDGTEIYVGDVYSNNLEDGTVTYLYIIKSTEKANEYAYLSNAEYGEKLLNNIQKLANVRQMENYVGNIYVNDNDKTAALSAIDVIIEYQKTENV